MDLQERLAESITAGTGLPIKVAYLAPDSEIGLVPTQGSHVVEEDYAGTQEWQYNYEITMQTEDAEDAKTKMFAINQHLTSLRDLSSSDASYTFESLEVNSAPSETMIDDQGRIFYALDIAVLIETNKFQK